MNRVPFTPRAIDGGSIYRSAASRSAFLPISVQGHESTTQGPGWFESSLDLIGGLDVREDPADEREWGDWLTQCLRPSQQRESGQGGPYTRRPEEPAGMSVLP